MKKIFALFLFLPFLFPFLYCQETLEDNQEASEEEVVESENESEVDGEPPISSEEIDPSGWMEKKAEHVAIFFVNLYEIVKEQFAISNESEPELKTSCDIDMNALFFGVSHGGGGLGISFEKQLMPHFAARGGLSHSIVGTDVEDIYCHALSLSLFARIYPMSRQLRKLYFGLGGFFDYASYASFTGHTPEGSEENGGVMLSFAPQVGYKFSLPWNFMLDVYLGYKFVYQNDIAAYSEVSDYLNSKLQYGISIKYTKMYELFTNVKAALKERKLW